MSRATRQLIVAVMALGIAVAGRAVLAKRKPPTACAAGRWVLAAPLVAGQSTPATGAVEAAPGSVAIPGVCPPVAPKQFKATAGGTNVKAKWPSCTGLGGKVTFAGTLREACAALRGTVKAKRFKAKVRGQRAADYVATTIGAAGGRVVSADGLLALDVPPGALAADTAISIRRAEASELPASVAGAQVAYDLGPDGLVFQAPVTVTYALPPPLGTGGALGVEYGTLVTVAGDGGTPEPLGDQRLVLEGTANLASAVGTLTHFTLVVADYGQRANVTARVDPGTTLGVGDPFVVVVTATFVGAPDVTPNPQAVSYTDATPRGGVVQYAGPPTVPMGTITRNRVPLTVRVPNYSCARAGTGPYAGVVQIDAFPPVNVGEEIKCGVTTTTTLRTTSTTRRTTTTSVTSTTATTRTTTTVTSTTSTSATVTTTTSTSTTTSTTTTTTLPQINCCDCPQPRGCASGPRVFPGDCVEFGCTFVANAVCTASGDCAAIVSTTTSTSSSTTTSTSTTSTSTSTSTSSSTSTIGPVPSTTSTTLPLVRGIPIVGPEALWVLAVRFYAEVAQGRLAVMVAGTNGWAIVDGATGEVLEAAYVTPFGPALFVAAPLGWDPPLMLTAAAVARAAGDLPLQGVIQAGPSGPAITLYDVDAGQFGFTQVFPGNPACFDAVPNGNDPLSGEMVLACGSRLQTLKPDATSDFFTTGPNHGGFTQATGPALSAFRRRAGGPVVAVTQGTPGKVMKHPATGTLGETPQEVGAAGDSPRRIRCAPNGVCAVSNFGSDSLTILTWDAQDVVTIVGGPVPVGDGPVGIDIRPRTDGNVEVVSTGFNDNSYSITVLRANGSTVSNRKAAVPTGCTKPGHAVWGSGAQIVVTCNGSDAIAVVPNP